MMEGFGVHTFRLINEEGKSTFVEFHWKPLLGMHGVSWDEAKKFPEKILIFTAKTCGMLLKMVIIPNMNWSFN